MNDQSIYKEQFVKDLFDEMSKTYELVNWISSFGFSTRWRKQCVKQLPIHGDAVVVDLMAGMAELSPLIAKSLNRDGKIISIDNSASMCENARKRVRKLDRCDVRIRESNVLKSELRAESADFVVSSFGLKTFSKKQIQQLANQIRNVLKPGGQFALVEISDPPNRVLRWLYIFYLCRIIPWIGWLFQGNPDNYRLLGVYTQKFRQCERYVELFQRAGLTAKAKRLFFGCGSMLYGAKPST